MSSIIQVSVEFNPSERSYREMKAEWVLEFERQFIDKLIERHAGNLSAASKEVKIEPETLVRSSQEAWSEERAPNAR